jgi:putative transposase
MGWDTRSVMDQRLEFVRVALLEGSNRRELCRRFGISPQTGYKWLERFQAGEVSCADHSRRPHVSPRRSAQALEASVLAVRDQHPAWGARKIHAVLAESGTAMPVPSTVHAILRRHDRIIPPPGGRLATGRFERAAANELWQMDFKGWSRLGNGQALHPLTVVDDHSRFSPCIEALADETGASVKSVLERVFRSHGLPLAFYADNGKPWGDIKNLHWTRFSVWLLKLGIELIHSTPYRPQGRGKNERFHLTLKREVLDLRPLHDHAAAQRAFDAWRHVYNHQRPHDALDLKTPASRYQMSPRPMPHKLPEPDYGDGEIVRQVSNAGHIAFKGKRWRVPKAFRGERLVIRPTLDDGCFTIFFASHPITKIDLTSSK